MSQDRDVTLDVIILQDTHLLEDLKLTYHADHIAVVSPKLGAAEKYWICGFHPSINPAYPILGRGVLDLLCLEKQKFNLSFYWFD